MGEAYAVCPNCIQPALTLDENDNMLICTKCEYKIPSDIYMMSLQLLQKDIIVETLRQFIRVPENKQGYGMCILYNNIKYVVGFDNSGESQIIKFDSPQWNQGSMVLINFDSEVIDG